MKTLKTVLGAAKAGMIVVLSAMLAGAISSANARAATPIPVETLAKPAAISYLSLSRDGDYLVGLVAIPGDKKLSLAVWDTNDFNKPPKLTKPDGSVEFVAAQAMKAGKILVFARKKWTGALAGCGEGKRIGSTKTYLDKLLVTDINFKKFDEPYAGNLSGKNMSSAEIICSQIAGSGGIASDLPLDPENVIFYSRDGIFSRTTKYLKYNLKTGKSDILFKDKGHLSVGMLDLKTGFPLTKSNTKYEDSSFQTEYLIRNDKTGEFEVHDKLTSNSNDRHDIQIVGHDYSTGNYYVATDQKSDKMRIYNYNPSTRQYSAAPLYQNAEFNVSSIIQNFDNQNFGNIIGYQVSAGNMDAKYIDPKFKSIQAKFAAKFPGKAVRISDWSFDKTKWLVTVSSSDMPPTYFLSLDNGKTFKYLGTANPALAKTKLAKTNLVYYTARDGMKIPALLTLPVGWQKGNPAPPAVIHPHGGPWARDVADWDPSGWVQLMASRGYAVLQPQYRGSTGWGRKLWLAGDAQWGYKMQDDKDDGAKWMVENGYANPKKIAIFGYSYGGYAAFAAAVRPNSPYQCAIAGAGVSDLKSIGRNWSDNRLQRAYQGKTVKGLSPLAEASHATLPMLIFHGDHDVRVPLFHSKNFYKKGKKAQPMKLVVIKDQPHSLPWTEKMQLTSLHAIEDYLQNVCFK